MCTNFLLRLHQHCFLDKKAPHTTLTKPVLVIDSDYADTGHGDPSLFLYFYIMVWKVLRESYSGHYSQIAM